MRRKRRLFQHRREVSQCHCLYLPSTSTNLDSTFHSSLELDDKHGGAVKVMNENLSITETKLSKSADRIKELETEKKILERENVLLEGHSISTSSYVDSGTKSLVSFTF